MVLLPFSLFPLIYTRQLLDGCAVKTFFSDYTTLYYANRYYHPLLRTIWVFNSIEMIMIMTGGIRLLFRDGHILYVYEGIRYPGFGMAAAMGKKL